MEWTDYIQFFAAFAAVMALMGLLSLIMRKFNDKQHGFLSKQGRLAVTEQKMIDSKHKLVLIRRDNTEHLVILSPHGTLTVENGITPPAATPTTTSKTEDVPVETL